MNKIDRITANLVFFGQVLLLFLLVFESYVRLPAGLQVIGRMHPLLLHLPIGFWVLLGILHLPKRKPGQATSLGENRLLLNLTALTATATALMGVFLSREGGYEGSLLQWHKWTGAALSFITYGLFVVSRSQQWSRSLFTPLLLAGLALVVLSGHFGASLTHGPDFLLAPLRSAPEPVTEATPLFDAAVAPILEQRCAGCHNERKAKGRFIVTSTEELRQGGKNGPAWVAGDPAGSRLFQRLTLPLEHEEHMPPAGKPQPSAEEIRLLQAWIANGADFHRSLGDYGPGDTLRQLADRLLGERLQRESPEPRYDFPPAPAAILQRLNTPFRTVVPVSSGSPALHAEIFVHKAYDPEFLRELRLVKDQLISLNLANLPIRDEDLTTIAEFKELRTLILNGTQVSGAGIVRLQACRHLESLALAGTEVESDQIPDLTAFPSLKKVYLWNTALSPEQLNDLAQRFPLIDFSPGYLPDSAELLPLSPPQAGNERQVLAPGEKIALKHPLSGVVIRYTTDGSEPDSLDSPVYDHPIAPRGYTVLKAKAFREHWRSSPTVVFPYFPQGLPPEEVKLLSSPDPQYRGSGAASLSDGVKGVVENFRSPAWLGYREQPLIALADFGEAPPTLRQITLSYARKIDSYIMPPLAVEVWGGAHPEQLHLLQRLRPEQPGNYIPNQISGLVLDIPPSSFRYYRIVATPVPKLPAWHSGKGDKGWLFVDELLFN